jgi:hypothetical protein
MKKQLVRLAVLAALGSALSQAQAQNIYGGVGLPGIYTIGYAHPMSSWWGLRGEYSGGTSLNSSGASEGIDYEANFKSSRAGVFADWFPFQGGFRVVGGLTSNDTKLAVNATGTTATIDGNEVSLAGSYFNVAMKYPTATPYLGIGYGHQLAEKGLGFYFDLGVSFGSFSAEVDTNLVGAPVIGGTPGQTITQQDVDAEKEKLNKALAGLNFLPSVSLGLVYRF